MSTSPTAIEPRKRPSQSRAAATFEAVLEAAARILEEDGLDAVNTNAVAERAGVSVGSLYQYFPSKQAILAELIRRERGSFLARITAVARNDIGEDASGTIAGLIDAAVAHQLDRPHMARALEYAECVLPLEEETQSLFESVVREIETVLRRYGIADPHTAARDVVALSRGLIDAAGLAGEKDSAALRERVSRAVTGYLRS